MKMNSYLDRKRVNTVVSLLLLLFTARPAIGGETEAEAKSRTRHEFGEAQSNTRSRDAGALFTEPPPLFRAFGAGMFLGAAGDLATTEWGLAQPGIRESNVLAANRGVRISTHVLAPALVWWTTDEIRKSGHPKLAFALRIGITLAYSYAVAHNLRTINAP